MNLYPVTATVRHFLISKSTAGYGVHSPFVYDFLTTVVRGKTEPHIHDKVEKLRREMLASSTTIRVTDMGRGSVVSRGAERRISDVAAIASLPRGQAALLARVARGAVTRIEISKPGTMKMGVHNEDACTGSYDNTIKREIPEQGVPWLDSSLNETGRKSLTHGHDGSKSRPDDWTKSCPDDWTKSRPDDWTRSRSDNGTKTRPDNRSKPDGREIILELGTSLGISTLALALALPEHKIVTVEGCPTLAAIARENIQRHGAGNVEVVNVEFSEALQQLRSENARVSFAFIDGNHRGSALIQYLSNIEKMGEEMIIVADDIHMSRDMYRGWRSYLADGNSSAAIETFRFGILFRLRSITPGCYRIRC
jgi:hypothetical protein